MKDKIHSWEHIRTSLWDSARAVYALVAHAKNYLSNVPPPPLSNNPLLEKLSRLAPSNGQAQAMWEKEHEVRLASAGTLLDRFFSAYVGLEPLLHDGRLDLLVASLPQTTKGAEVIEASPATWTAGLALRAKGEIVRGAGLERLDLSQGRLQEGDRESILRPWPEVCMALAVFDLPDFDELRIGLEQNLALAAEKDRDREALTEVRNLAGREPNGAPGSSQATPPPEQIALCAKAVAFMADRAKRTGRMPTMREIAEVCRVSRSTLYRNKEISQAREALWQYVSRGKPRGEKSAIGDIEAFSDRLPARSRRARRKKDHY